jgi:cell division protein FtsW
MEKEHNSANLGIIILACTILLVGIGFGFLYSASQPTGIRYYDNQYYYLIKQGIYFLIGVIFFVAGFIIDPYFYFRHIKKIVILTIILLIITLIPGIGKEVGGGRRWISFVIFQFQPSELAKLTVVFYLSFVLANKKEFIKDFYKGILPPLLLVSFISLLIFAENDFSTTFLILLVAMIIFFLAGIRLATLLMLFIVGLLGGVLMIFFAQYRISRFFAFINPWTDPLGTGWQYIQSMKAFALGGFFGRGIGESTQKNFSLPEAHNDYIFAIVGEEGGALFAVIIILLFSVFAYFGYRIAKKNDDKNLYLLVSGITTLIYIQAMINIGVVIDLLPSTGITLPFISAGGTSLIIFMFAIGVLINISFRKNSINRSTGNILY